jgi:putative ABC transport system permease protein
MSWGAFPMSGDDEWLFWMDGYPKPTTRDEMNWVLDYVVDPDYLKIMQTPLRGGRFFSAQDDENAPKVVVVDEVLARKYFGNENPIGKRLFLELGQGNMQAEIVGVAAHVKQWGLIPTIPKASVRSSTFRSCNCPTLPSRARRWAWER